MEKEDKLYFRTFEKLSLDEIKALFKNLKHIGMSDEDIEKYAIEYNKFFSKRLVEKKEFGQDIIEEEEEETILIGEHDPRH